MQAVRPGQVPGEAREALQGGVSRGDLRPGLASSGWRGGGGQVGGDQHLALLATLPGQVWRLLQDKIQVSTETVQQGWKA